MKIIEFFKKKNNFKKKIFTINPIFYWKIVIFSTAVIIILSFIFGYYFFVQINQEFVLPTITENGQVGTVDRDQIEKVLNIFSERAQTSNEILNSPASVVDPSL